MEAMLDGFHSSSLNLIDNMISLCENMSSITVDGLYDVKDKMQKVKEIYSTFIDKIFNGIPEGIANFHSKAEEAAMGVLKGPLDIVDVIENALRKILDLWHLFSCVPLIPSQSTNNAGKPQTIKILLTFI